MKHKAVRVTHRRAAGRAKAGALPDSRASTTSTWDVNPGNGGSPAPATRATATPARSTELSGFLPSATCPELGVEPSVLLSDSEESPSRRRDSSLSLRMTGDSLPR